MSMNRRNVLVGLGTIVAGGGAALGTGAFSSVEADRTVSLTTAGDSGALLGLEVKRDTLQGSSGDDDDVIEIDVDDLNLDALTTFDGALEITNNSENSITVDVSLGEVGDENDSILKEDDELSIGTGDPEIVFAVDSDAWNDSDEKIELGTDDGSNNQTTVDIIINTLGMDDTGDGDDDPLGDIDSLLFEANQDQSA
ncbi:hypothetical protein [Natronorubrum sp. A-ect3]|uniref:hypothetical protein n=1 Tax=Natronorubrum sp. A-ect3 TaxID=3242698 RepID=UPI00359EB266